MLKIEIFLQTVTPQRDEHPCAANPCGANAVCTERGGAGACKCLPDYFGDPYSGCRPQCVTNSECPSHYACLNNKCKDPCPGVCAFNAECRVINHSPQCNCMIGYVGNPLTGCHKEEPLPPPSKIALPKQPIRIGNLLEKPDFSLFLISFFPFQTNCSKNHKFFSLWKKSVFSKTKIYLTFDTLQTLQKRPFQFFEQNNTMLSNCAIQVPAVWIVNVAL